VGWVIVDREKPRQIVQVIERQIIAFYGYNERKVEMARASSVDEIFVCPFWTNS
jgi:hypothetical protein